MIFHDQQCNFHDYLMHFEIYILKLETASSQKTSCRTHKFSMISRACGNPVIMNLNRLIKLMLLTEMSPAIVPPEENDTIKYSKDSHSNVYEIS